MDPIYQPQKQELRWSLNTNHKKGTYGALEPEKELTDLAAKRQRWISLLHEGSQVSSLLSPGFRV